jgi:hypothetical protein
MATEDFKRKLTAILSADVKGYSRLMGEDEEATVRTITAHRKVITSVIQKYRLNNKEKIADHNRKYRLNNKEKIAEQQRKYRAKKKHEIH